MTQQINLYKSFQTSNQDSNLVEYLILGLLGLFLILLIYSSYLAYRVFDTEDQLATPEQQKTATELQLKQLQIQFPKKESNPLIAQELRQSQNDLNYLERIFSNLSDHDSDQSKGFQHYFLALARQNHPDVWLSHIRIQATPHRLELQGDTHNEASVAVFLDRLKREPAFQGKQFAKFMIQNQNNTQLSHFTVSTTTEEPSKAKK